MVNVCRSHITALEKVVSRLGGWKQSMNGMPLILTQQDTNNVGRARWHIEKAIEFLKKCKH